MCIGSHEIVTDDIKATFDNYNINLNEYISLSNNVFSDTSIYQLINNTEPNTTK